MRQVLWEQLDEWHNSVRVCQLEDGDMLTTLHDHMGMATLMSPILTSQADVEEWVNNNHPLRDPWSFPPTPEQEEAQMTDAQRKLDLIRSRRSGPTTTTVVLTEPGRFIHSRFGSRQPLAGRLMWHVRCPACRGHWPCP